MKIYLAGVYTSNFHKAGQLYLKLTPAEKYHRDSVQHILESYHYISKEKYVEKLRVDGVKVFLDSGAYSAFSKGVKVNIQAYCQYIQRNSDVIDTLDGHVLASVLDAIGDPQKTYENQLQMEAYGVRPLPCFHYGEDERYLEWYLSRYDYITIGGMVPISTTQLYYWLDRIWERYLCDGSGRPKYRIHGFGLTTLDLMHRYPWYSVDSSSWVQIAAGGNILIPGTGYIAVSSSSPQMKVANRHLKTYPQSWQEAIVKKVQEVGFEMKRLEDEYVSRWSFNCWAFGEINKQIMTRERIYRKDQIHLFS